MKAFTTLKMASLYPYIVFVHQVLLLLELVIPDPDPALKIILILITIITTVFHHICATWNQFGK